VKYLLDTNVLSDFARGDQTVMARLRQEAPQQLAVSVITELEVEYGLARNPGLAPRLREAMRLLLNTIEVLPFEREDARVAAQLRASLNSQGAPIGAYDLLLAACALRRGLKIVTHNSREFARIGVGWRTGARLREANPTLGPRASSPAFFHATV
jgi:tRNA(fMet)-specific endonuclease VapC